MSAINIPSPEPSDERVEAVLRAALIEFSEVGFALTSLRKVALRAGVSPHFVRRHFADKHELFRDMVRWSVIHFAAGPDAVLATITTDGAQPEATVSLATSATEEVARFARRYWAAMEQPDILALVRLTIAELPRFPELAVFHTAESLERLLHELERIIIAGVHRGELQSTDVRAAARTVLATLAAHAIWFAYPDIYGGLTGADRGAAASATIEALLRSLRAPESPIGGTQ